MAMRAAPAPGGPPGPALAAGALLGLVVPVLPVLLVLLVLLPLLAPLTLVARSPAESLAGDRLRAPQVPPASPSTAAAAAHLDAERWAEETLARLTLEQKVGQLVCAPIEGGYRAADDPERQAWVAMARDHGIGMFVVYGGTPHETARLLNDLQRAANLPLLVAADFEGGPGQQFDGATEFPANMALAAIGSTDLAYEVGRVGALEGRAIGVHVTYSPVVDIQTDPANPVLSVRSFGRDPDEVGRLAAAYIRGYQDHGMLATAKHYPGRGDVELIPGTEFTVNRKPPGQLEREDLLAFRRAIEADVTFIMSEHIAIPSLTDGSDLPASVEPTLASEWLRDRLGFTNVLTTDDLWYPKVTERFGPERVSVMAIKAGHDMLLKPADPVATVAAVAHAVRTGEITEARIDRSARRVLYWKARLGLHRDRLVDVDAVDRVVGHSSHLALMRSVAEQSLTLVINDDVFPTNPTRLGRIVHVSLQKSPDDAAPRAVAERLEAGLDVQRHVHIRPDSDPALRRDAIAAARAADSVVVSIFRQRTVYRDNGALPENDRRLIEQIVQARPSSTIVMSYGNPYVIEGLARPAAFVVGYGEGGFYGNQLAFADAFVRLLGGEIRPRGRLPVRLPGQLPVVGPGQR